MLSRYARSNGNPLNSRFTEVLHIVTVGIIGMHRQGQGCSGTVKRWYSGVVFQSVWRLELLVEMVIKESDYMELQIRFGVGGT